MFCKRKKKLLFVIISDVKMELAFLLDANSNNFRPDQFDNVLNSVKSTYGAFIIGKDKTRIGVVTYSERPRTAVSLDQYTSRQSLDTVVDQTLMSPLSTNPNLLGQGLAAIKQLFHAKSRPETPKLLVVITGGKSRDDVIKPTAALKALNTTIFCVGVGQNVDRNELETVATTPTRDHVIMAAISHRETAGENLASRIKKGEACQAVCLLTSKSFSSEGIWTSTRTCSLFYWRADTNSIPLISPPYFPRPSSVNFLV